MPEDTQQLDPSLWKKVTDRLKNELSEQTFSAWIEPLTVTLIENQTVTIEIPNDFHANWLRDNYHGLIVSSFETNLGFKPTLNYDIAPEPLIKEEEKAPSQKKASKSTSPADAISAQEKIPLRHAYTFDSFVIGTNSDFAHAAAWAVSIEPARKYNPLFVHGSVGLGKTHLIQAIAHEISVRFPHMKSLYISSEKFTNLLISAIQNRTTSAFRKRIREVDVLLIDDIQFIANREATQEEFFHTFNTLYDNQKQIILTSDRPAKDIPGLEARLVSRFEWGLTTEIQAPDFETRVAILKKKMEKETVSVPTDVMFYIAQHIKSNIRELEGSLIRVVAYSSLMGKPVTLEMVQEILKASLHEEEKKITIPSIQQKVAEYFNINVSDMRTKKKHKSIAYPRQIAMYLVRDMTEHSLPEIGEFFGGRDHSTVLYGIKKITTSMETDNNVKKIVDDITVRIKQ